MFESPHIRAMTSVLVAVGLICGGVLLLGDRFDARPGDSLLTQAARVEVHIAACVAEENMRLIDPGREHCRPGELTLVPLR